MESSDSFFIGENTLREIELRAQQLKTPVVSKKCKKDEETDVIIEESPNANSNEHSSLFFKSLRSRDLTSRKFSKSKSTSIISSTKKSEEKKTEISSISKYLQIDDINFSTWEKSAAKLISPMVQRKDNKEVENLANYLNLNFDSSDDNFDDSVTKNDEIKKCLTPILSQDIFTDDPLDTAISGDVDAELTFDEENLECSIRDRENVSFIQPNDPVNAVQETQNFIDDMIELQKSSIKSQNFNNNSFVELVNFSTQNTAQHEKSLRIDSSKNLKLLSSWNLPKSIVNEYRKKKVVEMFDWQVECLKNPKVLFESANLVYSAPTSAGKTFVSEILMIKSIMERKKKAIFILPFVSVVREKMFYFQELLTSSGIRVEGFYGGYHPPGGFEAIDLAVCTIEKANSIINKLLEQDKLNTIGMIAIDEVHLISDPSRGYILELLLTKILYMSEKFQYQIQLVTMSATLPNIELLRKWLNAEFYHTDYRPIELKEMIKINKSIYDNGMNLVRNIEEENNLKEFFPVDTDEICYMVIETIIENCQVIVFCPSKDWCEKLSTNLARGIYNILKSRPEILEKVIDKNRLEMLNNQAKAMPSGIDAILQRNLVYGSAFHHAGLTTDERDLIEMGFKDGIIKALFATSTLSSGVNLPVRRVIIRTPLFGNKMMNNLTYRQMIGRAGRKGKDVKGESILVCDEKTAKIGKQLVVAPLDPISSCLDADSHAHFKRALLEIIASGVANTRKDLENFVNSTLFCQEHEMNFSYFNSDNSKEKSAITSKKTLKDINNEKSDQKEDPIKATMEFLLEYEFIRIHVEEDEENSTESKFVPTRLGLACLSSAIPPKDGFLLFSELQKARQNFVLESELHAVYLVTPFSVAYQLQNIDWIYFADVYDKLPEMMKRVGAMVGVSDTYLIKAITGKQGSDWRALQIHKRFYTALALQELINEKSISEVSQKYKIHRGLLQNLQQMASTFAGVVTTFCKSLDWNLLALILTQFRERLYFGIHPDLIDLMKIPSMCSTRVAKSLFKSGIEKLTDLANAKILHVENVLIDLGENFFVSGKSIGMNFRDMAKLLIEDARNFIQNENGLKNVEWSQQNESEIIPTVVAVDDDVGAVEVKNNKRKASISTLDHHETPKRMKIPTVQRKISPENNEPDDVNESLFQHSKLESSNHLEIIDVLASKEIFENCTKEILTQNEIGLSIGVSKMEATNHIIGKNLLESPESSNDDDDFNFIYDGKFYLDCVCLNFDKNRTFYFNLQKSDQHLLNQFESLIQNLFKSKDMTINIYDTKESLKILQKVFGDYEDMNAQFQDPRIASWLIDPDTNLSWTEMVDKFTPDDAKILEPVKASSIKSSLGLSYKMNNVNSRQRAAIESFLVNNLIRKQLQVMQTISNGTLIRVFKNLEMVIQISLLKMETTGFPINEKKLYEMIEEGTAMKRQLESHIYELNNGQKFNLSSSKEVSKVLGIHKNLEKKKKKISTAKNVLEKLDLPIAKAIMSWRTLEITLTNMKPKVRLVKNERIYGTSFSLTQTGRISMYEPNLQNVTKDFTIELKSDDLNGEKVERNLSFRSIFECSKGKVLLAADFCQLELRILTHLCKDHQLMKIMNTPGDDIFRMIAAKWNRTDVGNVKNEQRNQTKQLCYGIIYGMGNRALAETMNVDEETAARLSSDFHATYPGIKRYRSEVVEKTRERGFCHTLIGRRRYLPAILSTDSSEKSQAERQALNTAIQGTASDLVKNAIIRMERNLHKNQLDECKFVLHLHDELFYEVDRRKLAEAAKILTHSMENAVKLSVPLKVKLKYGSNWGDMKSYEL